jgi:hypothetical protein
MRLTRRCFSALARTQARAVSLPKLPARSGLTTYVEREDFTLIARNTPQQACGGRLPMGDDFTTRKASLAFENSLPNQIDRCRRRNRGFAGPWVTVAVECGFASNGTRSPEAHTSPWGNEGKRLGHQNRNRPLAGTVSAPYSAEIHVYIT